MKNFARLLVRQDLPLDPLERVVDRLRGAAQTACEVDERLAVDVLDPRSLGARDDEPWRRDARNDEPRPRFENSLRGRLLLQRHGPTDYPGSAAWISIKSR
jgi:hypothetical protein